MRRYVTQAQQDAYMTGQWYKQAEETRRLGAKLMNAEPKEIAFIKNTSEGLAFVANGLDWHAGEEIVSSAVEYPANVYPWMDVAQRFGVKHIMVPQRVEDGVGRIPMEDLVAAVTPRTRMIALSHVEFASGFRHDLAAIGRFCRERNLLFTVDAIQSCGVLPVDVRAMNIDFLSAGGHKWMLGPEGCGLFFCNERHITSLRPEVGWMNVVNAVNFSDYNFTLRADAKRFECGGYNIAGVLGLGASLELLLALGIELISRRVLALTERLCEGLKARGYQVFSSRRPGEASGIVSFTSPGHDPNTIAAELEKQRIIVVIREGRLRVAPHFYNTPEQIDALVAALPGH